MLDKTHQVTRGNSQCVCKTEDRCKCRTFLGTLKGADMATLGSGSLGKLILSEGVLQAQFLQHLAKNHGG